MIQSKIFELRDNKKIIPFLVLKLDKITEEEKYLFKKSGYYISKLNEYLFIRTKENHIATENYLNEINQPLFQIAIEYITTNWDILNDSAVVDVNYISGKTNKPVEPYRYDHA